MTFGTCRDMNETCRTSGSKEPLILSLSGSSIPSRRASRNARRLTEIAGSGRIKIDPIAPEDKRWQAIYTAIPIEERKKFEREQQRRFLVELDKCHGSCLLEKTHRDVAAALEFFHGKRVWLGDYVVMPNHVHVIVQPFPGVILEEWLYSLKRFTSTEIAKNPAIDARAMMREGHMWQTESFDRIVRDGAELARTRQYIANNPARLRPGTFAHKQMEWLNP